jgi:hypothetical protein
MTHGELISSLTRSIRTVGAAAALDDLRRTRPAIHDGGYHDTLAVFYVWGVDRLLAGGLGELGVLWHPLTQPRSALSWWHAAHLFADEAREHFVPSTLARAGEPRPAEPATLVAA